MPANPSSTPIVIEITGLGHVPSFKNSKQLFIRNGKPRMATKPAYKKWMARCIRLIEFTLLSRFRIAAGAMLTGDSLPSWTASSVPFDDSVDWIPEILVTVERVPKGEEGATITIERHGSRSPS